MASDNDNIRRLLREQWPADVGASSDFRACVWDRIEASRAEPTSWFLWLRLHRASVAALGIVTFGVAVAGGGWMARVDTARAHERLVTAYLGSIDPHARLTPAQQTSDHP